MGSGTVKSNHRTDLKTFAALDKLPSPLFREVCFASRVWDAPEILDLYQSAFRDRGKKFAIEWLTASIHAGDDQDVLSFAWRFEMKYKRPLPHLAAGASILRFRPAVKGPSYRLRTTDVRRKAAWRASERLLPKTN